MERVGSDSGGVPLCLEPRANLARSQFVVKEKRPYGIQPNERKNDRIRLHGKHNYPVEYDDFF